MQFIVEGWKTSRSFLRTIATEVETLSNFCKNEQASFQHFDRSDYFFEYRLLNKDRIKLSQKQYRRHNSYMIKELQKRHRLQNKHLIKVSQLQYRLQNKDKINESQQQYRYQNKDTIQNYRNENLPKSKKFQHQYRLQNKDKIRDSQSQFRTLYFDNDVEFHATRSVLAKSWKTPDLIRRYLDSIANQLFVSSSNDWYRISRTQIGSLGGDALFSKFHSLGGALQFAYPEINWDLNKFSMKGKKSLQRWLKVKIEDLLPGIDIIEDYNHPDLSWENSERRIELDLWIPEYRIGIEYQGEQHYYNLNDAFGPNGTASLYCERDLAKHALCQLRGITLVTIPYWWDGEIGSLSATLYEARPDVFPVSSSSPIPIEMPIGT